jgi:predicted nucleic acid-binding protein
VSVYVDTSALIAVLDADDAEHGPARSAWAAFMQADQALVTSNYVIVETVALVQHRLGMEALAGLCDETLPVIEVRWISREEHEAALRAALAAGRRKLSFVDCVSFEVMRRHHLRDVFAFDAHFAEQGFNLLPRP